MSQAVSQGIRYRLWRRGVPKDRWAGWLADEAGIDEVVAAQVIGTADAGTDVDAAVLGCIASRLGVSGIDELAQASLADDGVDILLENLRYLFNALPQGGKQAAAVALGVQPGTVSRWLQGSEAPPAARLDRIRRYFMLPETTDLRRDPLFLHAEPVTVQERREELHRLVDRLSATTLDGLFVALRRLLREP